MSVAKKKKQTQTPQNWAEPFHLFKTEEQWESHKAWVPALCCLLSDLPESWGLSDDPPQEPSLQPVLKAAFSQSWSPGGSHPLSPSTSMATKRSIRSASWQPYTLRDSSWGRHLFCSRPNTPVPSTTFYLTWLLLVPHSGIPSVSCLLQLGWSTHISHPGRPWPPEL